MSRANTGDDTEMATRSRIGKESNSDSDSSEVFEELEYPTQEYGHGHFLDGPEPENVCTPPTYLPIYTTESVLIFTKT